MANNLDERLLNRDELNNDEQTKAAGELRGGRRSSSAGSAGSPQDSSRQEGGEEEPDGEGPGGDGAGGRLAGFREKIAAARALNVENLKKRAKQKIEEKIFSPGKQFFNEALKQCWESILYTGGISIIFSWVWIHIHVFLHWVLGDKLFCSLGGEWIPPQVAQASGEAAEKASKGLWLIEVVAVLIVDFIILAVILGALALIVMIVDFMQASWYEKIWLFIGGLTKLGWSGISALYNLF